MRKREARERRSCSREEREMVDEMAEGVQGEMAMALME